MTDSLKDTGRLGAIPRTVSEEHWSRDRLRERARVQGLARRAFGISEGTASVEVAKRDAAMRRLLAFADVLALVTVAGVVIPLLGNDAIRAWAVVLIPLVLAASAAFRLQSRDSLLIVKNTLHELPALLQIGTLITAALFVGEAAFVTGDLGASQGLALWLGFPLIALLVRAGVRRAAVAHGEPERVLVLGDPLDAQELNRRLTTIRTTLASVVASVEPSELPPGPPGRAVLMSLVREQHIHRLIIAAPDLDSETLLEVMRDMKGVGVRTSVRPRLLDVVGSAVEFDDVQGTVFLGLRRFGLSAGQRRVKRALDLGGAAVALILFAPVFAVLAVAIPLDSRGPVFFRQTRVGRDGRRFCMWKFRTMVTDAEARKEELRAHNGAEGGLFKMTDDPRVTRLGRTLRRTSLDELPQLFNVLRGEMSLVGPRPLVLDEDEQVQGWHRRRLHLTPGMTGVWQVLGGSRVPLQEMVALDYLYIVNWSVWRDIETLLRTIEFVVARRGR